MTMDKPQPMNLEAADQRRALLDHLFDLIEEHGENSEVVRGFILEHDELMSFAKSEPDFTPIDEQIEDETAYLSSIIRKTLDPKQNESVPRE